MWACVTGSPQCVSHAGVCDPRVGDVGDARACPLPSHPHSTPTPPQSVWWVFKRLHEKGLVYRSFKVMPYSTACNTPLSNFEANLNYHEDTVDPAVVVSFPLLGNAHGARLVAWTTTPWTLPSNLALCVHPTILYCKVKDVKTAKNFILAKSRLVQLYPKVNAKE